MNLTEGRTTGNAPRRAQRLCLAAVLLSNCVAPSGRKLFSAALCRQFKGTNAAALPSTTTDTPPHSMETTTQKNESLAFFAQCHNEVSSLRDVQAERACDAILHEAHLAAVFYPARRGASPPAQWGSVGWSAERACWRREIKFANVDISTRGASCRFAIEQARLNVSPTASRRIPSQASRRPR